MHTGNTNTARGRGEERRERLISENERVREKSLFGGSIRRKVFVDK